MTADAEPKPVELESDPKTTSDEVTIPPYLQKLLETVAKREGFADGYQIISRPGSNVGDGFVGIMLSVVLSGTRNGNVGEELVLVCKIPPLSEMRQKMAIKPFLQEISAYDKILPALVEFQREKGVSETDGFYAFPKCYGTYADEEKCEFAIILEDLRHIGYRMWNKYAPIDYKHVKLAVTQLGKFHALSFALRQQRPELFEQYRSLGSAMYNLIMAMPEAANYYVKNFDTALDSLLPEDTEEIRKITYLRENYMEVFRSSVSGSAAEPFTVLCHGDFWNNNMMFKYSSADSLEPQQAVLIDWQISQYCSPATDLTYYLYSSTEQSVRTAHFDDILHDYHSNLTDLLQRLGGNPDKQFSSSDLQEQLETFGMYSLVMAPILIQVVTMKAENLPDMDSMTEEGLKDFDWMVNGKPDGFNKRMRDVIRDFVGRGYFGDRHLNHRQTEKAEKDE